MQALGETPMSAKSNANRNSLRFRVHVHLWLKSQGQNCSAQNSHDGLQYDPVKPPRKATVLTVGGGGYRVALTHGLRRVRQMG